MVPFVSANRAMTPFVLNEMLLIDKMQVGFRVLWVPLDPDALALIARAGAGVVFSSIAGSGRFSAGRSGFRNAAYNKVGTG